MRDALGQRDRHEHHRRRPFPSTGHPTPFEARAGLIEVTGGGARIVKIGVVVFLALLICWPLLLLVVAFVVPVVVL